MRAAAIAIVTISIASVARAQPPIAYQAPEDCPDRAAIEARLAEHLRAAPAGVELPELEVRVRITGAFDAEITILDQGTETRRAISDPSCEVVVDAAALIVAVALVPDLDLHAPRPAPPPPSPQPISGAVWLGAHGSIGALPGIVLGGELAGAVRLDVLRVELALRGVPLVGARFAIDPSVGGDLGIVVGLARAIAAVPVDPALELRIGGGLEAGAVLGRGVGLSVPRDAAAPWVAIEAAAGLAWVLVRAVAIVVEVEALVPIVRPVLTVSGLGTLYRPEPICGALRLALEFRFP